MFGLFITRSLVSHCLNWHSESGEVHLAAFLLDARAAFGSVHHQPLVTSQHHRIPLRHFQSLLDHRCPERGAVPQLGLGKPAGSKGLPVLSRVPEESQ